MSSLYLDHFGLSKPPFQITPDLDFFFSGGRRGDILSALLHVAAHDEGIITLVAEVGSGKTLLARLMISRLVPEICAVYLANPCFSRDEIVAAIARDLGLTELSDSIEGKLAALQKELLRRHAAGQRVLLVVDEAHAMPAESLEEVRLLSNLETGQHKLINIMLFGQPELDTLLADPRLRQVRDRVIHRFELAPLQSSEASAYIDHRLRAAGWQGADLFSKAAMVRLIKASDGRARRINLLADKALLAAYAQGDRSVAPRHVDNAVQELPIDRFPTTTQPTGRWRFAAATLTLAVFMTIGAVAAIEWYRRPPSTVVVAADPKPPAAVVTAAVTPAPAPQVVVAPIATPPVTQAAAAATPAHMADTAPPAPPATEIADTRFDAMLVRTQSILQKPDLDGYTIQLAALPSNTSPDRYLEQIKTQLDMSKVYARYSVYKGMTYMSVYFGKFESYSAAASVVRSLPAALKNNRPLVRTWIKIKEDQAP